MALMGPVKGSNPQLAEDPPGVIRAGPFRFPSGSLQATVAMPGQRWVIWGIAMPEKRAMSEIRRASGISRLSIVSLELVSLELCPRNWCPRNCDAGFPMGNGVEAVSVRGLAATLAALS